MKDNSEVRNKIFRILIFAGTGVVIIAAVVIALLFSGSCTEVINRMHKPKKAAETSDIFTVSGTGGQITAENIFSYFEPANDEETTGEKDSPEESAQETTVLQTTEHSVTETTQINGGNTSAKLNVKFNTVNSWDGHYQYSVNVQNVSSVNISSWKITVDVPSGCTVENNWNCNCSISGNTLTISPVEYNTFLNAGQSISDMGIIFACQSPMNDLKWQGIVENCGVQGGEESGTGSYDSYIPPVQEKGTPLSNHGKLWVKGTNLVDCSGNKFQLKGVSTHGITWFPQYVNKEAFKTLRDDWGANAVRLALYTAEYNGYCSGGNKAELKKIIEKGVEYATELGMYVIIDWHILQDGNPNQNKTDALAFFGEMAQKYSAYDNVIYEICNEPNGGVDWNTVKNYADEVIAVIRKYDPDAVILVGTPTWSQEVDKVAKNPVANPHNVMYVLHFYAATHKEDLRNKLKTAVEAGTPVFISEFSICDASGNGGIDYASAEEWKKLINSYNISYIGWNLSNKSETSSLIESGCDKNSGWKTDDLSDTGKWLRNFIAGY